MMRRLRSLRAWCRSLFRRRPEPRQALSATEDPVAQLLEVAEEAVAILERSGTEETRGWAEAAVRTLDGLAGEDLFVRKLPRDTPDANRDLMEILAGDPEDLVGELIAQHQQASPAILKLGVNADERKGALVSKLDHGVGLLAIINRPKLATIVLDTLRDNLKCWTFESSGVLRF